MKIRSFDYIAKLVVRTAVLVFGMTVIAWGIVVVPVFWAESIPTGIASRIIASEAYKSEMLAVVAAQIAGDPRSVFRSSVLSKLAIIRLRLAEDALVSGNRMTIDARLDQLARATDEALMNAPNDSYQWLVRLWAAQAGGSFSPDQWSSSLRMSYTIGPYEGWIALKRSRLALTNFTSLPSDLVEAVFAEFVGLVRSQLYNEAVDILAGPGWPVRDLLLARLRDVKEADRRVFARVLYDKNLLDGVVVPGIARAAERPWH